MKPSEKRRLSIKFHLWLESDGKLVIGKGGAGILENIEKHHSISKAAKNLGISYRKVWNYLARMEGVMGRPIVKTFRGGRSGGGGAKLTRLGKAILGEYRRVKRYVDEVSQDGEYWEAIGLKLSARNKLEGIVKKVNKGDVAASVKVEIQTPITITAIITREAAEELGLKVGDQVRAVIKATEIMISK